MLSADHHLEVMFVREYILILRKDIVVLVPAFGESLLAPVLVSIVFVDAVIPVVLGISLLVHEVIVHLLSEDGLACDLQAFYDFPVEGEVHRSGGIVVNSVASFFKFLSRVTIALPRQEFS